ncbi:MAG: hypothetical protein H7Z14_15605 [Anaerolineae bacterium]|nr:hypothetical protein [Phycisphaerae bacterium]
MPKFKLVRRDSRINCQIVKATSTVAAIVANTMLATSASAQTWNQNSVSANWSNPLNWVSGVVPTSGPGARLVVLSPSTTPLQQDLVDPFVLSYLQIHAMLNGNRLQFEAAPDGTPARILLTESQATFNVGVDVPDHLRIYSEPGGSQITGGLNLNGAVTGAGAIEIVGAAGVQFHTISPSFTGTVSVGRLDDASAHLQQTGAFPAISNIFVNRLGEFRISNSTTTPSNDRINDAATVHVRGGRLSLIGNTNALTTEYMETLSVERGQSTISGGVATNGTRRAEYIFDHLQHSAAGVLMMETVNINDWRLVVNNAPTLTNSTIGGWAIEPGDFLTYDPAAGAVPLSKIGRPSSIDDSPASGNVYCTVPLVELLTADRTINTFSTFTGGAIDLNGHRLTLTSGGMFAGTTAFANGTITSGVNELYFNGLSSYIGRVDAVIADGPAGATGVVINSQMQFAATNTYSGPTTIISAGLRVAKDGAVPINSEVTLDGGRLTVALPVPGTLHLGLVNLIDGDIDSTLDGSALDVQDLTLDHGNITTKLVGNGPIHKLGDGTVTINNGRGRTGLTVIDSGTLRSINLGTGTVTVNANGTLAANWMDDTPVDLNGGTWSANAPIFPVTSTVRVKASSKLSSWSHSDIIFDGVLEIPANVQFQMVGMMTALVRGDTRLDGSFSYESQLPGTFLIFDPNAGKTLRGRGSTNGRLIVDNGGIVAPGASVGELTVGRAQFGTGGIFEMELGSATGMAGANWDLLHADGTLTISATSANPYQLRLVSLDAVGQAGALANFNPISSYDWIFVEAPAITLFSPDKFLIDVQQFVAFNDLAGGSFSVAQVGTALAVRFTPIPEPYLGLFPLATYLLHTRRRRRLTPLRRGSNGFLARDSSSLPLMLAVGEG